EQYAKQEEKTALIYVDEQATRKEATYATLMDNVNKIGNILLANGLKTADTILVSAPRIVEAYEAYLSGLRTCIIIVRSSSMLTTEELQYRITHGEIQGVVAYGDFVDAVKGIQEYENMIKFSIGEKVAGWHYIDDLKESASNKLDIKTHSKD